MSAMTSSRSLTYWVIGLIFLFGGGPIMTADITISEFMHNMLDGVAALTSILATLFVFLAWRKTRSIALLIATQAFFAAAALELFHELADSGWLLAMSASSVENMMLWTWHAARMFLACGLLLAGLHMTHDNFGETGKSKTEGFLNKHVVTGLMAVALPLTIFTLLAVELPSIYNSTIGVLRVPDLISGVVFLVALFLLLRKGNWRTDSYGHWLNISVVLAICSQVFLMAFSQEFLDSSFAAAHIVKSASFACVIYGFATTHKTTLLTQVDDDNQPKGLGLGVKVAVVCGFIGIICVIPVAIYSANNLHQIAANNGMEKLSMAAVNTSKAMDANRRKINDELKEIAESDSFNRTRSSLARLGKQLLEAESGYISLSYINAITGEVVTRFETGGEFGLAALNRDAIQASEAKLLSQIMAGYNTVSIARSRVSMLEGRLDDVSGVPVEGTAIAVYRSGIESPVGVLVAHNDLSAALKPQQVQNTDARLYVVNSAGQVLIGLEDEETVDNTTPALETLFPGIEFVDSELPDAISGTSVKLDNGQELLLGFSQASPYSVSGEPLLYIYTGSREQMEIAATRIGENLQRIAQFNLLIAIAIGWLFARRVSRPVQQISAAAVEFGRSGSVTKLPDAGDDEIGLLTKSLSEMMYEVTSQRERLLLLSQAVESSVDSTIITSIHGTIQYVNPEYERYSGVAAKDIMGKNIMELKEFIDNRHILSKSQAKKGSEMVWVGEMLNKRADGQVHDEYVTISPIRNEDGEQINQSLVLEDITKRKAMERHIELKTEELQRSNRDLEQFAYVASHDLKAPLRAIEVLVSWLKDDLEGFEGGDVHENLDLLDQRTARLARLLDDLLAYSRAGRKIGGVKKIDSKEFVEDIAALIAPPEGFVIDADDSLPTIVTHHAPLETVFRNLMSNAIKHSPDAAKGRIHVSAEDRGDKIEFVVQDNGTGIPQEYAEKVFKMFQTLKARDEMEGSGMGLAIVKRIIDWQLGDIWFHDGPDGVGTVFRFTWSKQPVELPDMPDSAAAAADAVESPLEKSAEAKPEEKSDEDHSDVFHSEQEAPEEHLKADQTITRNSDAELMEEEPS